VTALADMVLGSAPDGGGGGGRRGDDLAVDAVSLLVRLADAEVLDLELRVEERLGVGDGGPASTRWSSAASITSSTRVHGPPLAQHSAAVEVECAAPPQRSPLAADAGRRHIHPMLNLARLTTIHGARGRGQECEVAVRCHLARRKRVVTSGDPRRPHGLRQELRTGLPWGKLDPGRHGHVCSHVLRGGYRPPGGGGRCGCSRGHGLRAGPGSGAGELARLRCQEGRRRGVLAGTADGPRTEDRKETREKERWWDPQFGGGFGGPPRMEGERRDSEGHAKWRSL
jgi:hypothetical protein